MNENLKFNGIEIASAETGNLRGTGLCTEILYDVDTDEVTTSTIDVESWSRCKPGVFVACRTADHMSVSAIKAEIIENLRLAEEYGIKY